MKVKSLFFIICFFFFPIAFTSHSSLCLPSAIFYTNPIISSPDYGVSGYAITQSVKYKVEINFSLTHTSIPNYDYWFKFSRLNDRQPSSPLTQFSPPYQESKLLSSNIIGSNDPPFILQDTFNNTYDVFNNTLSYNEQILLNQEYN
ncbi:MAG: hypothetical protein KGD65_11955, partial [Candidatus Lokiarchaeota archaeon]|nr:hypothetical protein [Candidatus Lokiarchaeota archaeon]